MEGNILVDEMLASCYAYCDHELAHFSMTPLRWFPKLTKWILGESNDAPAFVNIVEHLGRWVVPDGKWYEGRNAIADRNM